MRKWGIVITVCYALIVAGLLLPALFILAFEFWPDWSELSDLYTSWVMWTWIVIPVGGAALLLFLSVDASHRRFRPRQHVAVSITLAGLFIAILTFAAVASVSDALYTFDTKPAWAMVLPVESPWTWLIALWLIWTWIFYLYFRDSSRLVSRITSWLVRGSVLELLIVIPCHLIVRRRDECTAAGVTSFGIVTGIAIMLLAFGPSVLLLYKKRLDQYQK